ncbi:hypothetical protein, partial [Coprobacter fastidiosus]|uniref:hypothetical protein n=1 Tax=Coprobacter fastidiosus TaxID=1099853 RepID=UPI003AB13F1E
KRRFVKEKTVIGCNFQVAADYCFYKRKRDRTLKKSFGSPPVKYGLKQYPNLNHFPYYSL